MAPLEEILQIDPSIPKAQRLQMLDRLFVELRAALFSETDWIYGPQWIYEYASDVYNYLSRYSPIEDRVYLNWGSGIEQPFGVTSLILLNGAKGCFAVDPDTPSPQRVSISLFDLLNECLIQPDHWLWSSFPKNEFLGRIFLFNLSALRNGDIQTGLKGIPLQFQASELNTCSIPESVVHLASSQNMLSRSKNPAADLQKLHDIMAPGGLVYHHVNLIDPRFFAQPDRFHPWSFLTEDDCWPDAPINDFRASEWESLFLEIGFEILHSWPGMKNLPDDLRSKLMNRFARMSDEDLKIVSARWILSKPM